MKAFLTLAFLAIQFLPVIAGSATGNITGVLFNGVHGSYGFVTWTIYIDPDNPAQEVVPNTQYYMIGTTKHPYTAAVYYGPNVGHVFIATPGPITPKTIDTTSYNQIIKFLQADAKSHGLAWSPPTSLAQ